jgi:hypothetical protein
MSTQWATPGANAILGGAALPLALYIQRHTGDPGAAGTANVAADTRRIAVNLGTPAAAVALNVDYAEILNATTTETITHVTVWGALSGGTCYFVAALAPALDITVAETVAIAIGQLSITLPIWV